MKLSGGLHLDSDPIDQPTGTYRDARNLVVSEIDGVLATERGTSERFYKPDYTLLAAKGVRDDSFVLFYRQDEKPNAGEIGLMLADNSYTTILNSTYLTFATTQPLDVEYYYTPENELIVVWTDGVNPVRALNLNTTHLTLPLTSSKGLSLFAQASPPRITLSEGMGGTLESGAYSFLAAYELPDGLVSNYFGTYGSVLAGDGNAKVSVPASVLFSLSNLDTAYPYLRLYAVKDNNGTRTAAQIGRLTTTTQSFLWTGKLLDDIDPAELLVGKIAYQTAQSLTVIEDKLLLANLTLPTEIDYQPYANAITVTYSTNYNTLGKPGLLIQRSFCPSATYALYVCYIRPDGSRTSYYHIPGALSSDPTVYNPLGSSVLRGIDVVDYGTGNNLSYHRNEDEVYSQEDRWLIKDQMGVVTGSLKGQKVRHHRMPSNYRVKPQKVGQSEAFGAVDIGVAFHNIAIPKELAGTVTGVGFAYAVREYGDMDVVTYIPVLSSDFALDANDQSSVLKPQPSSAVVTGAIRGYDFGMMLKKPALTNLYLVTEYENGSVLNPTTTYFPGTAAGYSDVSTAGVTYLTAGNILQNNDEREDAFTLSIGNVYGGAAAGKFNTVVGDQLSAQPVPVASLRQALRNQYVGIERQNLSAMSTIVPLTGTETVVDSPAIFEGDVTRQTQTVRFMRAHSKASVPDFTDNTTPYKTTSLFSYDLFSRLPVNKRQEEIALVPLLNATVKKYNGAYLNQYLLNPSYELTNTFRGGSIAGNLKPLDHFPVRVAQSRLQGSETRWLDWRSFSPLDYYDHRPQAGPLINIKKLGETIVLHHEAGVYRTIPRQQLSTSEQTVYLGTGELFAQPPLEIIAAPSGYAGIRYRSGTLVSQFGYLFVDAIAGRVFLLNQTLSEISANGLRNFFAGATSSQRDVQLTQKGYSYPFADNPFSESGTGFVVGLDNRYRRLLITKRDYVLADASLWGDPEDIARGTLRSGKYYLVNGELFVGTDGTGTPVTPYVPYAPVQTPPAWLFDNLINVRLIPSWVFDNLVAKS